MTGPVDLLLEAASPAEFCATHLETRQGRFDDPATPPAATWVTLEDLLAADAQLLRAAHRRLVETGTPPKAAAKYLAGWVGGSLGEAVGFVHAMAGGAGLLADASVRWRLHPTGWPDRTDVSRCRVVVGTGHPWLGLPHVDEVGKRAHAPYPEPAPAAVAALVETLTPLIEACRRLATVGAQALWVEVADGIGGATAGSPELPGAAATVGAIDELLGAAGVPWRRKPRLTCAASADGELVVSHKGGCCLAYTAPGSPDAVVPPDPADDSPTACFRRRFPTTHGEPSYCSTCRLREPADVASRTVTWSELIHGHR